MKQQRKYREPKDTVWGKCLSGFIAVVFAVSTLTIMGSRAPRSVQAPTPS